MNNSEFSILYSDAIKSADLYSLIYSKLPMKYEYLTSILVDKLNTILTCCNSDYKITFNLEDLSKEYKPSCCNHTDIHNTITCLVTYAIYLKEMYKGELRGSLIIDIRKELHSKIVGVFNGTYIPVNDDMSGYQSYYKCALDITDMILDLHKDCDKFNNAYAKLFDSNIRLYCIFSDKLKTLINDII